MAKTIGMAIKAYLKNIEPRETKIDRPLDLPIRNGKVSAINTKLIMLKIVPRIIPLPIGF
jgi:hypothetical protein